jgi:hypothetical protein
MKLDMVGTQQLKAAFEAALNSKPLGLEAELDGRVFGRRWNPSMRRCPFLIICAETDEFTWNNETLLLTMADDAEALRFYVDQFEEAIQSGQYYPEEFGQYQIRGRKERDSFYIEIAG